MVLCRDVAHKHADLAGIDLAPVAAPLALDAHRMRAAFGETARIEGDDAIRLAQPLGHLPHQPPDQRPGVPWCNTDKVLHDLSLDIDPGRDGLGILAWQMRQEPLEIEVHGVRVGLGLERLLIGHDELTQTLHHWLTDKTQTLSFSGCFLVLKHKTRLATSSILLLRGHRWFRIRCAA